MNKIRSSSRIAAAASALVAALVVLFVLDLVDDRSARMNAGKTMAAIISDSTAKRLSARLQALDQILIEASSSFAKAGTLPQTVLASMRARILADPDIRALSYVDPDGILRHSVHKQISNPQLPIDVSDRNHYRQQRLRHEQNQVAVSPPVIAKLTNRPAWFMSRPLHDAEGRFLGLVVLVLETRILDEALAGMPKDISINAGIFSNEGFLFAQTGETDEIGRSIADSQVYGLWSDAKYDHDGAALPALPADRLHLTAMSAAPGFPLNVYAGLDSKIWIQKWAHETWLHSLVLAALAVLSGILIFIVYRRGLAVSASDSAALRDHDRHVGELSKQVENRTLELKKSLAALGESEERFRLFADIAPLPLIVTRRSDGIVVYINSRASETFQVAQDEAFGKIAPDFWKNPVDRARMVEFLSQGKAVRDMEAVLTRADGSEFVALLSSALGQLQGETMILVSLLDISDRKGLEKELARSNAELEQFSYAASHDLQEPLRMVAGYVGLIERRYAHLLDEDGREFVSFAVEGALRMSRLINDLLEYSRVHKHEWDFVESDLNSALNDALNNLDSSLRASGAHIDRSPLPNALADPLQIMRVFQNLIGNALKYRRPDHPLTIRIYADRREDIWTITIVDNGQGMSSDDCARMFQPFQRFHKQSGVEGTGLGLALCRRIIAGHGGHIWAESAGPDLGLTIRFTLPAVSIPELHPPY